ncbi:error-prone DNA polymerase [Microbacterium sp. STN6]|uniref:error-prone DNA polymerase n=1 Tax=Microbacterium sp. STN6 TaxID=2995588 RepID=UPI002260DAC2|nr:error-prone DNA polymerase [Microbacterium sp. STN6]MCX7521465.1 error-prone DNA polymerase [Microbacterium sp. STN6]
MGWNNPPIPWSELERKLSGRGAQGAGTSGRDEPQTDGAISRKRHPYRPAPTPPADGDPLVPYAELHAHSHYSFLDGASSPEELVAEASRLRLSALALTDHDGLYGIVRMAEAAEAHNRLARETGSAPVKTVFGAELSFELGKPQNGEADPEGSHLVVLARGQEGYHRLAGALTNAQLADGAEKGRPLYDIDALAEQAAGHWAVLTGCRKGRVRQALERGGVTAAAREVERLVALFGTDNVFIELFSHGDPLDDERNDALAAIAAKAHLPTLATNNVHYAAPRDRRLAAAVAAVRARRSLDELDGWLPASGTAHLRSGAEMAALFARYPGAVERTVALADESAFELRSARPRLPKQEVPAGRTPMSWLRELVRAGVAEKYPSAAALPDAAPETIAKAAATDATWRRLENELAVIEAKDFPGYFLIVHDIVRFARSRGILCQGRGSAANSAVCYAIGITAVDSIYYNLPFERFLSSIRDEEPDIDVDFDSDRREEVIQYVYEKYGRRNAAQVANVIAYRPKFAVRDMAKALGHSPGQQDAWSKQVEGYGSEVTSQEHTIPQPVIELATELLKTPRHLGIHSGGMVLTERPVGEVCPIEHARMENRTVLQWDKDDCEWMGLVKFDLLGLGMLAALQYVFDLVEAHLGERWSLATLPREEPAVYDMLCRADAVGVFQVESRAQMGTLPRLKPRRFYDLVIEVALIRPGPIQGGAVHPYIRRRTGEEAVTYLHPDLEPVLERTLGVPLFQEQLMQMAMAVGGCSAEDADLLRRAMGSKRGREHISTLRRKLYDGMAAKGISAADADIIYEKIEAFANFGFAESHSLAFALLVYASSWLKLHYPAAFLAALLRAQPMGFYAPHTLVADARRHGVEVRHVDVLLSGVDAGLEPGGAVDDATVSDAAAGDAAGDAPGSTGLGRCLDAEQPPVGPFDIQAPDASGEHRRDGNYSVRLGLAGVNLIGEKLARRIVAEREGNGPYRDMADIARRVGLTTPQLESLAAAGAFDSLGIGRRQAMWNAGWAADERADQLIGSAISVQPPLLPMLSPAEQTVYDLWATGISPNDHPIRHVRDMLTGRGALSIEATATAEPGRRIEVGGAVTHRQRPMTAGGVTFLNLEDETGILNVIVGVGVWNRYRRVARDAPAMIVRGILERSPEGITNLIADRLETLPLRAPVSSRDFQ